METREILPSIGANIVSPIIRTGSLFLSRFLFFTTILYPFYSFSEPTTETDKKTFPFSKVFEEQVAENFFETLIRSSTAGYVFYGEKPLYVNNYCDEKYACIGTKEHKEIIELHEISDIYENFVDMNANYFLHITKHEENELSCGHEILVINKTYLTNAINKNLPLFQYKLGVNITAEALVKKLISSKETISTLFKGNPALLGILLGYGTKNALMYERGLLLKNSFCNDRSDSILYKKQFQKDVEFPQDEPSIPPQFGYLSIREEMEDLSKSISEPTNDDDVRKTKIPFSYLKDSNESKNLIQMYDRTQRDINRKNSSKDLLKEISLKLKYFPEKTKDLGDFSAKQIDGLPNLIARAVFEKYGNDSFWPPRETFFHHFITGIRKAQGCNPDSYEDVRFFDAFRLYRSSNQKTQENIAATQQFFSTLIHQHDVTCVAPNKMYYRILKAGQGPSLNLNTKRISIRYLIRDIENSIICGSYAINPPEMLDLSCVTDGIVLGMVGMKKNEKREIFLHQDYFDESDYERTKGRALSVCVELLELEFGPEEIKLAECMPKELYGEMPKEQGDVLMTKYIEFCGFRAGLHYKKASDFFSLNDLLIELDNYNEDEAKAPLTASEKRFLRKFDLFLYAIS